MRVVPVLAAAEFWESQPFAAWSDKDVQRMLTDSPWSQQVSVVMLAEEENGDLQPGGRAAATTGEGSRRAPQLKLNIQWRSAQPMRQASARREFGTADKIPADVRETLEQDDSVYVVLVLGLPVRLSAAAADAIKVTFLKRAGRPPIAANAGGRGASGNAVALIFAFPGPRHPPQDNEVEFVTKIGDLEIKRKFKLKEMVAAGRLQL
jgi:hypothetical protein